MVQLELMPPALALQFGGQAGQEFVVLRQAAAVRGQKVDEGTGVVLGLRAALPQQDVQPPAVVGPAAAGLPA